MSIHVITNIVITNMERIHVITNMEDVCLFMS